MTTIKELEKEIKELKQKANGLEKTDIYSGDLVRIHSKLGKLNLILEQTKGIYEMIRNSKEVDFNKDELDNEMNYTLNEILSKIKGK